MVYEQSCAIQDDCTKGRYYITEEKYKELANFSVRAGDFLISCSGSIGRITQVPNEHAKGVINQALLRVRLNNEVITDDFFRMVFESPHFQSQILANSTGTAMVNVKGVKELKAITFLLPPLAEQERIVFNLDEQFSRLDTALVVTDQLEARIVAERRSLLHAAFSGTLTEQWRETHHG